MTHPGRLERLSSLDVSNLRAEDYGLPMHVAAIGVVDGGPLLADSGELRLAALRREVDQSLSVAPRLRQVLRHPAIGLGPPLWVDDPSFDIAAHVRARQVPAPGDEAALLRVCAEVNEPRLDRSRPLWELWLLPGLADGNVGMLIRLHHAVADGMAALALLGALFASAPAGASPAAPPTAVPPWQPRPAPGGWELLTGNLADRAAGARAALASLRRPSAIVRRLGSVSQPLWQVAHEGRAPRVSLNRPVGQHRHLRLVRADLARAKAVAHAHGATVNDVVLAAVAGGVRRLLAARGELRPRLMIKVSVATANRGPGSTPRGGGNLAGLMLVPVPVGEPDVAAALPQIARATAARKKLPPYQPGARFGQRWMVRAMFHQRLVNLFTSNLPGPPGPMFFAGARVLEIFQVGVVQGNVTIAVAVLSYAGRLNFTVLADAGANPDLAVFAGGLEQALRDMGVPPPAGR